ncbi:MAG: hypothetical protein LJF04_08925 [Gemmatimonadetes bacterium]|nr:hypothetical protein [Gemmatimonadota bacterium]
MLPRLPSWKAVALVGLSALTAFPLSAQVPRQREQRPDFLFKRPSVTFGVRVGYSMPGETPNDFNKQLPDSMQFMYSHGHFNSAAVSGELAVRATERLDVVADFAYSGSKVPSEYRDWVDNNDLPIQQTTKFTRRSLTFGLKEYLWDRGRSVGHLAWVPRQWAPFAGLSAGWTWYRFEQTGDFVDFTTFGVFPDRFVSSGRTGTVQAFAGADWTLSPNLMLTAEGRYTRARVPMEQDFQGVNINLSGFQASAGISLRF